ncbi:MAG: hypothetical protein MUC62_00025 [Candidatus Thermoplasmatota archaeon]|jgi:hypothetical protein|nr:hypothetical protein [Candidatus Thermoplasmatota archaeon]
MEFDLSDLKRFIEDNYSEDHPVYRVIMKEKDVILSPVEFLAKAEVWLRLVGSHR